jgi:HK97 family phage prohead protease
MTELIQRRVVGELEPTGDGRTLELRIVPYNVVSRVSDPPGHEPYDEVWLPGAFEKQLAAANRVLMNFEHRQGIENVVGRGTELRETKDALEGTFRMLNHSDGDKALELVNEKILTGVSLEAEVQKSVREDGIVKRMKARLINIALTRMPAFEEAQVLAVREQAPEPSEKPVDEPLPEPARNVEIDNLLERVGFEPLASRAVTRKPWVGAASKYEDAAAYCKASLIDDNPAGEEKTLARCHLPVYEPNGDLNANALSAAAGRLNQTQSPQKAAAARKLVRLYRQAGMEPPASLRAAASR